jgi:hypothetical protein
LGAVEAALGVKFANQRRFRQTPKLDQKHHKKKNASFVLVKVELSPKE